MKAGDAFIIPAEQVSYYQADTLHPWEYFWIGFTGTKANLFFNDILNSLEERYVMRDINTIAYSQEIAQCKALNKVNAANHYMANSILLKICSLLLLV